MGRGGTQAPVRAGEVELHPDRDNRWAIRLARAVTGRQKILVNSYCYHGTVDESLIVATPDGGAMSRPGNVGAPCDVTLTSRVCELNELDGLERELVA